MILEIGYILIFRLLNLLSAIDIEYLVKLEFHLAILVYEYPWWVHLTAKLLIFRWLSLLPSFLVFLIGTLKVIFLLNSPWQLGGGEYPITCLEKQISDLLSSPIGSWTLTNNDERTFYQVCVWGGGRLERLLGLKPQVEHVHTIRTLHTVYTI